MFTKIKDVYRNITRRVKNLRIFRNVIMNGYSFDRTFLYLAMKDALVQMEKEQVHCLHNERYKKQIRTTRLLLERIVKDEYISQVVDVEIEKDKDDRLVFKTKLKNKDCPLSEKHAIQVASYQIKQDIELVGKMIAKHSMSWWN